MTGKSWILRGLDQGQRLEQLVERPEPAGVDHERVGVLHEHDLAGEEVAELDAEVHVRVEPLLQGQLDVAADRQAAALLAATVGGGHDPRPAAGDDRIATLRKEGAEPSGARVVRRVFGRPGRSEDGHRWTDRRERVEPVDELADDPQHAPRVGVEKGRAGRSFEEPLVLRALPAPGGDVVLLGTDDQATAAPPAGLLVARALGVGGAIWGGVVGRMVHRG